MIFVKKENVIYKIDDSEVKTFKCMGFSVIVESENTEEEKNIKKKTIPNS